MNFSRSFGVLFQFFLLAIFSVGVFKAGYTATDWFFRVWQIPYPFEWFGAAVGLGFFFWALAAAFWVRKNSNKRSDPMKKILSVMVIFMLFSVFWSKPLHAEGSDAVMAKLSQIEQGQAEILKKLDEMMAELQIVKVRATLRS